MVVSLRCSVGTRISVPVHSGFQCFNCPSQEEELRKNELHKEVSKNLFFPFASHLLSSLSLSSHPLTLLSEKHLFLKVCTAATNCAVHALYTLLRRVQSFASTELLTCTRRWRRLRSPARPAPSPPLLSVSASLSPSVRNTE